MESLILRRHGAVWKTLWSRLERYGVAVDSHTTIDAYFCVFRATFFFKSRKCKIIKYPIVLGSTATWGIVKDYSRIAIIKWMHIFIFSERQNLQKKEHKNAKS